MALHSRIKRINEELRSAIASILMTELKDPRLSHGLITVTAAEISSDLHTALVWVSVLGTQEEAETAIEALNHSHGFVKHALSERIVLKYIPNVHFRLDRSGSYAAHINTLLKQIERSQPAEEHDPESGPEPGAKEESE